MSTVRQPAVAGRFYPADPKVLARTVQELLDKTTVDTLRVGAQAYVVPHAGYQYSGLTAAVAYTQLRASTGIRRIVLIGPAHFVPIAGCVISGVEQWHTPLGTVDVDTSARDELVAKGLATVDDRPHGPEHSLEVQLPFVSYCLGPDVSVLPIAVGPGDRTAAAALITAVAGPGTVVLCSTDLSHYLEQSQAHARDEATLSAVLDVAPERLSTGDACGVHALRALLTWAGDTGAAPMLLRYSTSADQGAGSESVVGYAALAIGPAG